MLLDEPVADLDPLARHELMGVLTAETAEHGTTIVMSSHILTELEGACDYLLFVGPTRPARRRGAVASFAEVHPASPYWPLQLVETGILPALAALAVFAAFRVLRRLHG